MQRDLRELDEGAVRNAVAALLVLRPRLGDEAAACATVIGQMQHGYRLLGVFVAGESEAVAVAGFRIMDTLEWGRALYVEDLVTLGEHRGSGHARALLIRLLVMARDEECQGLHLDAAVGLDHAEAHTLFQLSGLHVSALHFHRDLGVTAAR